MEDNMKDMFKNIEKLDINLKDFEEIKPPSYMYEPLLKKEWLYSDTKPDTKPVLVKNKNKVKKIKDKFKELRVEIGLKIAGKNIDDLI